MTCEVIVVVTSVAIDPEFSDDGYRFPYHCEHFFGIERGTLQGCYQCFVRSACYNKVSEYNPNKLGKYLLRKPLICRRSLMFSVAPPVSVYEDRR